MIASRNGTLGRTVGLLAATGLLVLSGAALATEQSKQRQDGRDVNQAAKQEARETKIDCRQENNKSNAACRHDKRDTKQDGRQDKRDIKY
jgi:uncharacterized membrane protein